MSADLALDLAHTCGNPNCCQDVTDDEVFHSPACFTAWEEFQQRVEEHEDASSEAWLNHVEWMEETDGGRDYEDVAS